MSHEPDPSTVTLTINVPVAMAHPLLVQLQDLMEHTGEASHARQLLENLIQSLRSAEMVTAPAQVPLRERLKFAADCASSYAARAAASDHPATSTLKRIADTLNEMLAQRDEALGERMQEVENLIQRLNEFAEE